MACPCYMYADMELEGGGGVPLPPFDQIEKTPQKLEKILQYAKRYWRGQT